MSWLRSGLVALFVSVLATSAFAHTAPASLQGAASSTESPADAKAAESSRGIRHASPGDAPQAEGRALSALPDDFRRAEAGWLTIEYHPSSSAHMRRLSKKAEEMRGDLRELLGQPVLNKVLVRLGRTPGEMEKLGPEGVRLPRYAAGVAFSEMGLVLLTENPRYPGERHDFLEIFKHELAHVALHDALNGGSALAAPAGDSRAAPAIRVPRWFNEGFAVYASGEAAAARVQALGTATLADNLIPLKDLTQGFPADPNEASVAYAQAADIVRYLLARGEEHRFRSLIERIAGGQSFDGSLSDAYSTDLFTLEKTWRQDVARRYTFWPVLLGGSSIWVLAIVLVVWGFVRRRRRARRKLDAWAVEEEAADARRQLVQEALRQAGPLRVILAPTEEGGTQVALSPVSSEAASTSGALPPGSEPNQGKMVAPSPPVPKVKHDGSFHTLH